MKILLISNNPPNIYSGVERHCYNIMQLFKDDKDVEFETLSIENVKHFYLKGLQKYVFSFKDLRRKISESNCDVIHIHGFALFVIWQSLVVAHKLNKRIVYTAHFHPFDKLNNPLFGKLFFNLLLKPCIKFIDTIITINKEDTKFFSKYHKNVRMIPNWVDSVSNLKGKKEKDMILFVGRNDSNKSPQYLLDLPEKYHVHCVTDKNDGLRDDFTFHKKISDEELEDLYSRSSLVVAPSRYEAFSYVVLEALLHNTPVLVSNNVRIVDYLDGIQGVSVFEYGNKKDFLDKIDSAINQKVDLGKIKEVFSQDRIKENFKEIYRIGKQFK